jgi:hypothetical protein
MRGKKTGTSCTRPHLSPPIFFASRWRVWPRRSPPVSAQLRTERVDKRSLKPCTGSWSDLSLGGGDSAFPSPVSHLIPRRLFGAGGHELRSQAGSPFRCRPSAARQDAKRIMASGRA